MIDPSNDNLITLKEKLLFVFSAKDLIFSQSVSFPGSLKVLAPSKVKTICKSDSIKYIPIIYHQIGVKQTIFNIGGMSVIIYFLTMMKVI